VALNQGFYQNRSVIANAQRAVNLYAERNAPDAEAEFTHYNSPGIAPLGTSPNAPARCLYWANNGQLYYLAGTNLYTVSSSWARTQIGSVATTNGIAYMADNGTTLLLVDGSANGYQVTLATNVFSPVSAALNAPPPALMSGYGFFGATRIDALDGFLALNQPGTRNFYCTQENNVIFDALNFAAKNGYSDNLVTLIVTKRELWLIGQRTTEIWFDSGSLIGSSFPFQILPGPFIQHGIIAPWSVAQIDGRVFWLSQDQAGGSDGAALPVAPSQTKATPILVRGQGYAAERISTHAIEQEWSRYPTVSDAVGFCFQFGGHAFYQINFQAANASWRWDEMSQLWHEALYVDSQGNENRHRVQCVASAYGLNVGADWQTGQLYQIAPDIYTDAGAPMYFRLGFPHMMKDGREVIYPGFVLDVECATGLNTYATPGPFPLLSHGPTGDVDVLTAPGNGAIFAGPAPPPDTSPIVYMRTSDTRGRTWNSPMPQTLGAMGQYKHQPKWTRTGRSRDRVFEVFGVIPGQLAINGGFLWPEPIVMSS
jgi:hypothetical protein